MRLLSLKLENIRSYEDATIEFPKGTTLFEGDIGSGKSTILMAIEFALFGLGDQQGSSLLRIGENKGSVTLRFKVNGTEYEVHRTLERKGKHVQQGEGYLKIGKEKEILSPAELKERILNILQFREPYNPKAKSVIYRYAVFTPQEEMKAILLLKPSDRIQTLRKAFGIEDYKIAMQNAQSISNKITKKANYLEGEISDLDKKKEELKDKENKCREIKNKLRELSKKESKLQGKLDKLKDEREKLREKEKKLEKLKGEIPEIEKQIEDKKVRIEKINKEIEELQNEIDTEIDQEIEELQKISKPTDKSEDTIKKEIDRLRELDKKHTKLKERIEILSEEIQRLEKDIGEYKDKGVEDINEEINSLNRQLEYLSDIHISLKDKKEEILKNISRHEAKIEEICKNLKKLESTEGRCPVCDSELSEDLKRNIEKRRRDEISRLKEDIDSLKFEKTQLEEEIGKCEKEIAELSDKIRELENIKEHIVELYKKREELNIYEQEIQKIKESMISEEDRRFPGLNKYETPIKYLEALLEQLRNYNEAQNMINELKKRRDKNIDKIKSKHTEIMQISKEMEELSVELKRKRKEFENLEEISEKISELEESIIEVEGKLKTLRDEITKYKTEIKYQEEAIKNLNKEINEKEKKKAIRETLLDYNNWLSKFFIPTLDDIEKQVMVHINRDFNQLFQRWFSLLVEDVNKEARIDEDFTLIVEQDGYEQDIDFLSGGEKTSLALAYRLALNNTVQKVSAGMKSNLLILDEPTDGFSKEQLFKLREILEELQCEQVIIVSHEKELESFADHIFYVEKSDGKSRIRRS